MEGQRGKIIGADTRTLTFSRDEAAHILDLEINLHATNKELVFEEFKDGFVGIRTHPDLRLNPSLNMALRKSSGMPETVRALKEKKIWGKRADWVHYHGTVKGKAAGIAFMSHPPTLPAREKNHGGTPVTMD